LASTFTRSKKVALARGVSRFDIQAVREEMEYEKNARRNSQR